MLSFVNFSLFVFNFLTVSGLFNNCSQYPADIYWKLLLTRIHKLFNKVLNKYRQIRVAIRDLSTSQISKLCTLTWSSSYLKKMVFASQYWPSRRISEMNTFPKLVIITQWTLRTQPPQSQNVKKKFELAVWTYELFKNWHFSDIFCCCFARSFLPLILILKCFHCLIVSMFCYTFSILCIIFFMLEMNSFLNLKSRIP